MERSLNVARWMFLLAALTALVAGFAASGQSSGPITTPAINKAYYYVGTSPYMTIQAATTSACAATVQKGIVVVPANVTPADTPAAATGCAGVTIEVQTAGSPASCYAWGSGGPYVTIPCVVGASGSGTVNTGAANQIAYYPAAGTAVSGTNALPAGTSMTAAQVDTAGVLLNSTNGNAATATFAANAAGIDGVTVTGTPSVGQVITATSNTTADWQPGGGALSNLTGDVLTNGAGSCTFLSYNASEGTIDLGGYPEALATALGCPNTSIFATGGSQMSIALGCSGTQCSQQPKPVLSSVNENDGVNSTWPVFSVGSMGVTANTISTWGFGFNEMTSMAAMPTTFSASTIAGLTTTQQQDLDYYKGQTVAWMYLSSFVDAARPTANSSCVQTSGTWATAAYSGLVFPPGSLMTTSGGGVLTCSQQTGTYGGAIVYKNPSSASTFTMTVNGISQPDPVTGSTTISQTAPYGNADLYAIGQQVTQGTVTTVYTAASCSSSDPCIFIAPVVMSAGAVMLGRPKVMKQLTPYQKANGTCSGCAANHSDAQIDFVRTLSELAAVSLGVNNGMNWNTFDINAGFNINNNAYTGKVQVYNITAAGSGYTSTPTVAFSGSACSIEPTALAPAPSGGALPTNQYYTTTSGACLASAPTCTVSGGGGTGATCSAVWTSDFVHPNYAATPLIESVAQNIVNDAKQPSDAKNPQLTGLTVAAATQSSSGSGTGPYYNTATLSSTSNVVIASFGPITGTNRAITGTCYVQYPDPTSSGHLAATTVNFSTFVASTTGAAIAPATLYTYAPGTPFGSWYITTDGSANGQLVLPVTNYGGGAELISAACQTGGGIPFAVLPAVSASGTTVTSATYAVPYASIANVTVGGGTIDGTTLGATTPAPVNATQYSLSGTPVLLNATQTVTGNGSVVVAKFTNLRPNGIFFLSYPDPLSTNTIHSMAFVIAGYPYTGSYNIQMLSNYSINDGALPVIGTPVVTHDGATAVYINVPLTNATAGDTLTLTWYGIVGSTAPTLLPGGTCGACTAVDPPTGQTIDAYGNPTDLGNRTIDGNLYILPFGEEGFYVTVGAGGQLMQTNPPFLTPIYGTTGTIGGSSLTPGGPCATGTATISGGSPGHTVDVSTSDGSDIGGSFFYRAVVTNSSTVTVSVCAVVSATLPSKSYNVVTY